jgi:hypothetical protein
MATHDIQRVLRARYGGIEASDVLVQFARIELERPDALVCHTSEVYPSSWVAPVTIISP